MKQESEITYFRKLKKFKPRNEKERQEFPLIIEKLKSLYSEYWELYMKEDFDKAREVWDQYQSLKFDDDGDNFKNGINSPNSKCKWGNCLYKHNCDEEAPCPELRIFEED